MSGRLLNTTLLLTLSSFPALGLLLTLVIGPFGGPGWSALLVASALGSGAVVVLMRRAGASAILDEDETPRAQPRRASWLWPVVVVLAFVPLLVAVLGSPRMQISHHGYFHSAYVYQVFAGHVPPENVTLPGHPSNTYWPYHALLAALVGLFAIPAPLASALLNLAVLAGSLAWTLAIVRELYGPIRRRTAALLAVFGLFGANLFGGLYWLLYTAAGMPLEPRTMVLVGDVRLSTLLAKFANYTGAALGVYFYLFALLVGVRLLRGRVRGFDLVLAAMALLGAFALHAITGAFMAAGFPPALACAALLVALLRGGFAATLAPRNAVAWLRGLLGREQVVAGAAALVVLLVLGVPVLVFMVNASSEFPEPPHFGLPDAYALSIVGASYPLLPFFVLGIVHALRQRDARLLFLALVCLGGYALASVVSISGRNEYKFIYLGSLGLCLVALEPITRLLCGEARGWRGLGRAIAWMVLLLPCVNVAEFGLAQLRGELFGDRTFRYEGRHIVATPRPGIMPGTGLEYADLFAWARAHSPADTVLVVPMIFRDRSVLYVLSERVPYVVDGLHYNRGLPDFALRSTQVAALYGRASQPAQREQALRDIAGSLPGRPKLLVFPRGLAARFDPRTVGLERVHEGAVADLYAFPGALPAGAAS